MSKPIGPYGAWVVNKIGTIFYHAERMFTEQERKWARLPEEDLNKVEMESLMIEVVRAIVQGTKEVAPVSHYLLTVQKDRSISGRNEPSRGIAVYGEKVEAAKISHIQPTTSYAEGLDAYVIFVSAETSQ